MLDTALQPRAFPPEVGSLLPGLLAATRTGPSPADDDELVAESRCSTHRPPTVWAHPRPSWKSDLATVPLGWSHIDGWCQLGLEFVAAVDEVGFDVDREVREASGALDFAEASIVFEHAGGGPAQAHLA